jgi:uroporphyrin-III C-methyltransferase
MSSEPGEVILVGAGPGPADLLTLRAVRAIEAAEAILYDALVGQEVLAMAPAACLKLQTGKRSGKASLDQELINQLMLRLARRGLRVVRLKGGDPSVFARSGEELAYLERHGIRTEVVPGVTAAAAAAAQFGFPLTHRGEARRLVLATARVRDGRMVEDGWGALADPQATLCLYMGRDCARAAAKQLIGQGLSPSTPALAVENAGSPAARLLRSNLGGLGDVVESAGLSGPVLLVIGKSVARARDPTEESNDRESRITLFG